MSLGADPMPQLLREKVEGRPERRVASAQTFVTGGLAVGLLVYEIEAEGRRSLRVALRAGRAMLDVPAGEAIA